MRRAKITCHCISFLFRATSPKSEQSSNFLFLMPKEKKPKQWVSVWHSCVTLRYVTCIASRYACSWNVSLCDVIHVESLFDESFLISRPNPNEYSSGLSLQRASVLTGLSRVRIGASRNSSGEIFFWTRPMDYCRMTNSRYSVRYIPLYVDCHIYPFSLRARLLRRTGVL